jgi:hypothetical protein
VEAENLPLNQRVADLSLDKQLWQDVLKKSSQARAASARGATPARRLPALHASRVPVGLVATFQLVAQPYGRDDPGLRQRLRELAQVRVRYGCPRLFTLLRRQRWPDNHKRVPRLYCWQGLPLRSKRPKRSRAAAHRLERVALQWPQQSGRMDVVAD